MNSREFQLYGEPWREREYIVVLDVYFRAKKEPRHLESAFIKELSTLLGRTAASILMRMENFASLDPEESEHRRGLVNIAPVCRRVFGDWKDKPDALRCCADVYRREFAEAGTLFSLPLAFGKYERLDLIGEGGSGFVYSCLDSGTNLKYAIKIIRAERIFDTEALHRFRREIRILRDISSPYLIRLYDDNLDDEAFPAFVMDLAECTLTEHLEQRERSMGRPGLVASEAVVIIDSVVAGVTALHLNTPPVIHRDINPSNILRLPGGQWVLADFGLAKFIGGSIRSNVFTTKTNQGLGTLYYPAPEQYRDLKRTDERTDVFALGVLLWELFSSAWPPPHASEPGLPTHLNNVYQRATQREPQKRHQTVEEFAQHFQSEISAVADDCAN